MYFYISLIHRSSVIHVMPYITLNTEDAIIKDKWTIKFYHFVRCIVWLKRPSCILFPDKVPILVQLAWFGAENIHFKYLYYIILYYIILYIIYIISYIISYHIILYYIILTFARFALHYFTLSLLSNLVISVSNIPLLFWTQKSVFQWLLYSCYLIAFSVNIPWIISIDISLMIF